MGTRYAAVHSKREVKREEEGKKKTTVRGHIQNFGTRGLFNIQISLNMQKRGSSQRLRDDQKEVYPKRGCSRARPINKRVGTKKGR